MTRALRWAVPLLFVSLRASAQTAPAPAPAPALAPDEVQVHGKKGVKAGQTTFAGAEVREIPGAFGDAFRVMEALPGVTPLASGLPFFFVRGAPPGNNGYFIDGIRVPLLYHVGAGPSVIHPGLVEHVDFYPGGYPARYGRYAGGILAGETRRPADTLHGEANIRLFDVGGLVEAPFGKDDQGTILLAGRYSYTAALISIAAPDAVLDYWDYQARATWRLGPSDTIGLFAFGSYDFFGSKEHGETQTALATQFHRLDARWDHDLPNGGRMRLAATVGSDATGTDELAGVRDRMVGARFNVEQPLSGSVLVRGGADVMLDHYDLVASSKARSGSGDVDSNVSSDDTSDASNYPPRNDLVIGMHLDAVIQATDRWEVTPGLRFDQFASVRTLSQIPFEDRTRSANAAVPAVDPRLLSRLRVSKAVTFVSTFGISHQPPAFFVPVPGLQLGRLSDGLQTSVQTSQGIEVALPWRFTLAPTLFYHRYLGLTDFATTCGLVDNASSNDDGGSCFDKRVRGRTIGLEVLLRRSLTQKLTGWISYTLSRTTRETHLTGYDPATLSDYGRPTKNETFEEIPGDFDRTHVLNVIGAYDLGAGWRTGARFYYYTGRPYSRRVRGYVLPPFNAYRFPDFYRIDLRLEKGWRIGQKGRIAFVLEWLNATLRKEAMSVNCGNSASSVDQALASNCKFEEIGPVTIPSLGVEGSF